MAKKGSISGNYLSIYEQTGTHDGLLVVTSYQYTLTSFVCVAPKQIVNGECVDSTPICEFGYHNDTTKTGSPCTPDKQCPATMRYFAKEVNWGFDLKKYVYLVKI